jgi:hypothetical protein
VPSRRKKWVLAAAAVGVLLLAYLIYARVDNYLLVGEVDQLARQSQSLEATIAATKKTRAAVAEIAKWTDDETVWLDQILALSESFPPPQDAILAQLTFGIRPGGSQVDVKGWVRNAEVIAKMEERVRARAGQIASKSSREDTSRKGYSWRFEASVLPAGRPKP